MIITFIKMLGCVLILISSAGMGMYFSGELKGRIRDLKELRRIVTLLRGDIRYANSPLPEAVQALSVRHDGKYKKFLQSAAERLNEFGGVSFCDIWKEAVHKGLGDTSLSKKDIVNLSQFGENMGYLDKEMQLNTIDLYLSQIEEEIKELSKSVKEKTYMYNTLGILGGIFLTIIML
ncbi:stage III sporulation protein AB [Anaerocolumna xylanovorans]|uniref:Stage III sporulation protein AB n=1 Tax=Anaerocolumna xylanovorans DSM 12503 TaxID=1121345 RepID=A0A1M7YJ14_9FIRM|nr:stage III sporulation protein AB [Anaerocolumna xylanovorans]SHO52579.1 stage III sporulation protein AB [Anaerocolumna xylanovorans DSM 12503]